MSEKLKINLNDYPRILLSETAPYDVPIIFTNNWFFRHVRDQKHSSKIKFKIIDFLFRCNLLVFLFSEVLNYYPIRCHIEIEIQMLKRK